MLQKNSVAFLIAGAASGALNYYFQILASQNLIIEDFGVLNAWIANVGVFLIISLLLQSYSVFHPLSKKWLAICAGAAVISLAALHSLQTEHPQLDTAYFALAAVFFGLFYGQTQGRQAFYSLSLSQFALSISKVILAIFLGQSILGSYKAAVSNSYVWAIVPLILVVLITKETKAPRHELNAKTRLLVPLLISLNLIFVPQMDVYFAQLSSHAFDLGTSGIVSLYTKGIFFVTSLTMQVLLPKQIAAKEKSLSVLSLVPRTVFGLMGLSALFGYFIVPLVAAHLHSSQIQLSPIWSAIACVHAITSTTVFFSVQTLGTSERIKETVYLTMALLLSVAIPAVFAFNPIQYLASAIVIELAVLLFVIRKSQPLVE